MKSEVIKTLVAAKCGEQELAKWVQEVNQFVSSAGSALLKKMCDTCHDCPFRDNARVGGCLGDSCPVFAAGKAVRLAASRAAKCYKDFTKAKYAANHMVARSKER